MYYSNNAGSSGRLTGRLTAARLALRAAWAAKAETVLNCSALLSGCQLR